MRKKKEKREKMSKKYWKMPGIDRIHYDNLYDRCHNVMFPFGKISWTYVKISVFVTLVVFMLSFVYSERLLVESAKILFNAAFLAFPFIFAVDLFVAGINSVNISSRIKKLNSRFKLE